MFCFSAHTTAFPYLSSLDFYDILGIKHVLILETSYSFLTRPGGFVYLRVNYPLYYAYIY